MCTQTFGKRENQIVCRSISKSFYFFLFFKTNEKEVARLNKNGKNGHYK